jgi:hypothetical protein
LSLFGYVNYFTLSDKFREIFLPSNPQIPLHVLSRFGGGRIVDAGNSLRTDVRSGVWGALMLWNPVGRRADQVACPEAEKILFAVRGYGGTWLKGGRRGSRAAGRSLRRLF